MKHAPVVRAPEAHQGNARKTPPAPADTAEMNSTQSEMQAKEIMTEEQHKAMRRLSLALDACHKAGLAGGAYEKSFRVWPAEVDLDGGCGD